jgi:tetratricopeptide (TPR) repeat protein
MRACIAFVAFLLVLTTAGAASAQDEKARAEARTLAQEGAALFEKDDFGAALERFQQAYAKFPSPKLFLNIGQALRRLGRNVEALAAFERFLAEAKDANPDFVEQANAQVAELKGKLARIAVESNRIGAEVTLDEQKQGATPLGKAIVVEPGAHRVTVTWEGESKTVEVPTVAGQAVLQTVNFDEQRAPPPLPLPTPLPVAAAPPEPLPPAAPEPLAAAAPPRKHTWYWVAGGAVVAAVATTLIILYARSDEYPNADLGRRTIGDMR